jgi:hypothetical protein
MVTPAAAPQAMVMATRRIRRYCIVPNPVVPRRRSVRQKRLTRDHVKAKIWRNRPKRTVSPVTPPSLKLLRQIVIGRSINAWLIERGNGPMRYDAAAGLGSATHEGRADTGKRVIINIRTFVDAHQAPDRVLPSML